MPKKRSPRKQAAPARGPLNAAQLQAVAGLFSVLAEGSRLTILQILQSGPCSVGELVERTALKQANVSKQLASLLTAGVIARRPDGNRAIYSIHMPLIFDLCDLVCKGIAAQAADRSAALKA